LRQTDHRALTAVRTPPPAAYTPCSPANHSPMLRLNSGGGGTSPGRDNPFLLTYHLQEACQHRDHLNGWWDRTNLNATPLPRTRYAALYLFCAIQRTRRTIRRHTAGVGRRLCTPHTHAHYLLPWRSRQDLGKGHTPTTLPPHAHTHHTPCPFLL